MASRSARRRCTRCCATPTSGFVLVAGPPPSRSRRRSTSTGGSRRNACPSSRFVVNRVHTDPAREVRSPRGGAAPRWPPELAARLAETLREQQVLARVERRAIARLEVDTRERPVLVPELEQDVHDLRGLAEFGELALRRTRPRPARARAAGGGDERAAHPLLRQGRRRQDQPLGRHRDPRREARPPHARRLDRLGPQPGRRARPRGRARADRHPAEPRRGRGGRQPRAVEPLGHDPRVPDALHDLPRGRRDGGRGDRDPAGDGGAVQPGAGEGLVREPALGHDRDRLRADRRHRAHAGGARGAELLLLAHLPDPAHGRAHGAARWRSA